MTDAPERIWAGNDRRKGYSFVANGPQPEFDGVEYVRADIHQAELAAVLEEAAARAGQAVKHHLMRWPSALYDSALRVLGVGRDAENPKAISICLSDEPSDDDLRVIHEFLKPPTALPDQVERGA